MIGLREKARDEAYKLQDQKAAEARAKFLYKIMEDENVDYETAFDIATGKTDPVQWEYTLGYKMNDPLMMLAMFSQPGKKARAQAIEKFEQGLTPEELEIFRRDVLSKKTGDHFRSALKRAKKS